MKLTLCGHTHTFISKQEHQESKTKKERKQQKERLEEEKENTMLLLTVAELLSSSKTEKIQQKISSFQLLKNTPIKSIYTS